MKRVLQKKERDYMTEYKDIKDHKCLDTMKLKVGCHVCDKLKMLKSIQCRLCGKHIENHLDVLHQFRFQ